MADMMKKMGKGGMKGMAQQIANMGGGMPAMPGGGMPSADEAAKMMEQMGGADGAPDLKALEQAMSGKGPMPPGLGGGNLPGLPGLGGAKFPGKRGKKK